MFILQRGNYEVSKMEYTYARRAQSTVRTLQWRDTATIGTDDIEEAIVEAESAIREWAKQKFTADRWRIEGRGKQISQCREIEIPVH